MDKQLFQTPNRLGSALLLMIAVVIQPVYAENLDQSVGFEDSARIDDSELASLNGRDNLTNVQSIQELDATVSNSSFTAETIMSGAITIEQHALDNFEGVGMFNIFTGNNNAVNSAVGISIYLSE
ncbi:hypothetical protein DV711_15980 [Motiliproteus coralliicola]|uniref:Uncharacterized protein n=1 Tax=Motiliproteus coralliicola TaxID=2283196 RepID=A0A369WAN8_9GAMM|nr:hypothetical protein [Motiliproteus coralliicola]RDE19088.1 hypothetical protein DV711_15980 [Motiliproteus coralliicola]